MRNSSIRNSGLNGDEQLGAARFRTHGGQQTTANVIVWTEGLTRQHIVAVEAPFGVAAQIDDAMLSRFCFTTAGMMGAFVIRNCSTTTWARSASRTFCTITCLGGLAW